MLSTIWASKSGMNANQEKLDAISNNIANVGTVGYKKVEVGFKDLMTESLDKLGIPINDKTTVTGTGVKTSEWFRNDNQGALMQTYRTTDIALDGKGYFRVTSGNGESFYTRNGSFFVDGAGNVVDNAGNTLDLEYEDGYSKENVEFDTKNLLVDKNGSVYLNENGKATKVAEIPIYEPIGDNALISVGNSYYIPTEDSSIYRTRDASFVQGFLENSNVDIADEFSEMILTQRAFELSSKGITTADEMWGMVNGLRR